MSMLRKKSSDVTNRNNSDWTFAVPIGRPNKNVQHNVAVPAVEICGICFGLGKDSVEHVRSSDCPFLPCKVKDACFDCLGVTCSCHPDVRPTEKRIADQKVRHGAERLQIILEMAVTEANYVKRLDHVLTTCSSLQRVAVPSYMCMRELQTVATAIGELRDLHHTLSVTLDAATKEWDPCSTTIGEGLLHAAERLRRPYELFAANHSSATSIVRKWEVSPDVLALFHSMTVNELLDVKADLVAPVQQVARYPLHLTRLRSSLYREHPDWLPLHRAAKALMELAGLVDKIIGDSISIQQYTSRIRTDYPASLDDVLGGSRLAVSMPLIVKVEHEWSFRSGDAGRTYVLLLFNHGVEVLCNRGGGDEAYAAVYDHVKYISLFDVDLTDLTHVKVTKEWATKKERMLSFVLPDGDVTVLSTESRHAKDNFLSELVAACEASGIDEASILGGSCGSGSIASRDQVVCTLKRSNTPLKRKLRDVKNSLRGHMPVLSNPLSASRSTESLVTISSTESLLPSSTTRRTEFSATLSPVPPSSSTAPLPSTLMEARRTAGRYITAVNTLVSPIAANRTSRPSKSRPVINNDLFSSLKEHKSEKPDFEQCSKENKITSDVVEDVNLSPSSFREPSSRRVLTTPSRRITMSLKKTLDAMDSITSNTDKEPHVISPVSTPTNTRRLRVIRNSMAPRSPLAMVDTNRNSLGSRQSSPRTVIPAKSTPLRLQETSRKCRRAVSMGQAPLGPTSSDEERRQRIVSKFRDEFCHEQRLSLVSSPHGTPGRTGGGGGNSLQHARIAVMQSELERCRDELARRHTASELLDSLLKLTIGIDGEPESARNSLGMVPPAEVPVTKQG